jgi:hypothetical protein
VNTAPKFSGLVGPAFTVDLVKDAAGDIKDSSVVEYKSPVAKDLEKDKISIKFDFKGEMFMKAK